MTICGVTPTQNCACTGPHPVGRTPAEQTQWERATRIARELTGRRDPSRAVVIGLFDFVQHDESPRKHTKDFDAEREAADREIQKDRARADARAILRKRQLDMFAEVSA